jgi:hypothetical protein
MLVRLAPVVKSETETDRPTHRNPDSDIVNGYSDGQADRDADRQPAILVHFISSTNTR